MDILILRKADSIPVEGCACPRIPHAIITGVSCSAVGTIQLLEGADKASSSDNRKTVGSGLIKQNKIGRNRSLILYHGSSMLCDERSAFLLAPFFRYFL